MHPVVVNFGFFFGKKLSYFDPKVENEEKEDEEEESLQNLAFKSRSISSVQTYTKHLNQIEMGKKQFTGAEK